MRTSNNAYVKQGNRVTSFNLQISLVDTQAIKIVIKFVTESSLKMSDVRDPEVRDGFVKTKLGSQKKI